MEQTIKYMLLKECAMNNENKDSRHLSLQIYEQFEKMLCKQGLKMSEFDVFMNEYVKNNTVNSQEQDVLERVFGCIKVIREKAFNFICKYQSETERILKKSFLISPEKEYFLSLFLVSLGVFAFSETEQFWLFGNSRGSYPIDS